jgi:hypothetical protein
LLFVHNTVSNGFPKFRTVGFSSLGSIAFGMFGLQSHTKIAQVFQGLREKWKEEKKVLVTAEQKDSKRNVFAQLQQFRLANRMDRDGF